MSPDELKKKVTALNNQLRKHGGSESVLNLKELTEPQKDFLVELFSERIDGLKADALPHFEIFYEAEIEAGHKKIFLHIHEITLPKGNADSDKWQIIIGENLLGSPQMLLNMKGQQIVKQNFVD